MKRKHADEDAPTCDELRTILDVEIGALAEKYRTPVVLCYLEDAAMIRRPASWVVRNRRWPAG